MMNSEAYKTAEGKEFQDKVHQHDSIYNSHNSAAANIVGKKDDTPYMNTDSEHYSEWNESKDYNKFKKTKSMGKADNLEKGGEGSRGGKIIGHTKSGKPIYASNSVANSAGFTPQDHHDAFQAHAKIADNWRERKAQYGDSKDKSIRQNHFEEARQHSVERDKGLKNGESHSVVNEDKTVRTITRSRDGKTMNEHSDDSVKQNDNGTFSVHVKTNKGNIHYNEDGKDGNMEDAETAKQVHRNMSEDSEHNQVHEYAKSLRQAGGGSVRPSA